MICLGYQYAPLTNHVVLPQKQIPFKACYYMYLEIYHHLIITTMISLIIYTQSGLNTFLGSGFKPWHYAEVHCEDVNWHSPLAT